MAAWRGLGAIGLAWARRQEGPAGASQPALDPTLPRALIRSRAGLRDHRARASRRPGRRVRRPHVCPRPRVEGSSPSAFGKRHELPRHSIVDHHADAQIRAGGERDRTGQAEGRFGLGVASKPTPIRSSRAPASSCMPRGAMARGHSSCDISSPATFPGQLGHRRRDASSPGRAASRCSRRVARRSPRHASAFDWRAIRAWGASESRVRASIARACPLTLVQPSSAGTTPSRSGCSKIAMSISSACVARASIAARTTASRPAGAPSTPTPIRCGTGTWVVRCSLRRCHRTGCSFAECASRIRDSLNAEWVKGRHMFCVIAGRTVDHADA